MGSPSTHAIDSEATAACRGDAKEKQPLRTLTRERIPPFFPQLCATLETRLEPLFSPGACKALRRTPRPTWESEEAKHEGTFLPRQGDGSAAGSPAEPPPPRPQTRWRSKLCLDTDGPLLVAYLVALPVQSGRAGLRYPKSPHFPPADWQLL